MKIKKIALDMDGVLANMMPYLLYLLNRYHGEKLTLEDVTEWDIHKACKNCTPEECYQYFDEPGFFRHLPLMPGAQNAVKALQRQGFEIVIISTTKHGQSDKLHWLSKNLPTIDLDNVFMGKNKYHIAADVFVDDSIDNLEKYKAAHPGALVICFDAPYNRKYTGLRAKTWDEVLSWIDTCGQVRDMRGKSE